MGLLERLKLHRDNNPDSTSSNPLSDINELRQNLDYRELDKAIKYRHREADLKWKKRYYTLRTIWAFLTIILLGISLWFTYWLVINVGTGRLDFTEYKAFLNIIAGEIIINILGLVAIVMHFLFPSNSKKP